MAADPGLGGVAVIGKLFTYTNQPSDETVNDTRIEYASNLETNDR